MLQAVIFDLDDTLYDATAATAAGEAALFAAGAQRLGMTEAAFRTAYEAGKRRSKALLTEGASQHNRLLYLQHALEGLGRPPFRDVVALHDAYWRGYYADMTPFPGVRETLAALRARGIRTALCTDMTAEIQFVKLERLRLVDDLDAIVTSEEVGVEKPAPAMFRAALEKCGVAAKHALMCGDSLKKDVRGAEKAGLHAAWYHEPDPQATCYHSYTDGTLLRLVETLA